MRWVLLLFILLITIGLYLFFKLPNATPQDEAPNEVNVMEVVPTPDSNSSSPDSLTTGTAPKDSSPINAPIETLTPKKEITTVSNVPLQQKKPPKKVPVEAKTETKTNAKIKIVEEEEEQPASMALLKITSAPPFASIQVDGEPWGETPMKEFKKVPPGTVKVKLTHRLFPALDTVIGVSGGEETEVKIQLKKEPSE